MQVIMLQDVDKLGKEGELVSVKEGYARNFLFPRKLAAVSTTQIVKTLEQKKKKREEELAKMKAAAEAIAKKIAARSCTISVEAGVEDKIFGSITPEMVRNSLRQECIEIDKKDISIDEEIKKLGVYQAKVTVHPLVTAALRIWVIKK